jgi:LmbE family N-acetylglucosaminyl deacetylase
MTNKKVLIIAAHPDDEVLGCGGTINKLSKKKFNIKSVFFADGESSRNVNNKLNLKISKRKNDAIKASKILGYKKLKFYDFPDNKLYSVDFLKIIQVIEKEISIFKPEIIFTHFENDLNLDHSILSRATTTACRPAKFRFIKKLLYFHILSSTEWNFGKSEKFNPNYFVDISKNINSKIKAMRCYNSEIEKNHPRSIENIKSFAKYNGSIMGVDYAEPFVLGYLKK